MLRQFAYISTAASNLGRSDLDNILEASERNNAQNGVSGFLLFNGRNFLQLIEGEQAILLSLMNRLARDVRHGGIVRLEDHPVDVRVCPNWTMKRLHLLESQSGREKALNDSLPETLLPQIRHTILNFAALN